MTDHEQILLTLDYYFEEKIFDGSYDSAKEVLAEAGLPYERLPQIMRTLREMDAAGELEERYGANASSRLTPNRALTRATLERLAWQATPEDERSATGRSILQRRGEERGVTRVPLSSMTDHQLRAYIGPGALEEAGDMKKNGIVGRGPLSSGPAGEDQNAFAEAIVARLSSRARRGTIRFSEAGSGTLFINYVNVPPGEGGGGGAERENNRTSLSVTGFGKGGSLRCELSIRFTGARNTSDPVWRLRTKTAPPERLAQYIADYISLCAEEEPKLMSRNARREEPDETAARELSLFIENDYSLVGAPNSQGKSIEANLLRKIKNGSFDLELSEQAWMYLMETGAKKYAKEFGDGERAWSKMFNKPTRELVAHEFATTFAEEHKLSRNAAGGASGPFTIEDLNTLTGTRQHRKATQYESLAEAEEVARGKASRSRSFAQFNVLDARGNVAFSISGHH